MESGAVMLSASMLSYCAITALFTPLVTMLTLGISYFIMNDPNRTERFAFRVVRMSCLPLIAATLLALISWIAQGATARSLEIGDITFNAYLSLRFNLFFDIYGMTFLVTVAIIFATITIFSHRYLHRDPGYRRFFMIMSLLIFGVNLIILAGSFDLIFAGWEIVGISSFLLIAYFWHRPKAVAAAKRAYYIYRFTDLGLLVSILITHMAWHDMSMFIELATQSKDPVMAHIPTSWRWILSVCILLPVLGKSAQFPFCFWLPKAMEGPTHSSAIFYGSLSVHMGVFLLIRTMPIWYLTPGFPVMVGVIGVLTAVIATLAAQVQSNIKGQIGYASVAQVGIMLIELSLGLTMVAFIHAIGNAFLRMAQLLVSSSILATHVQMQTAVKNLGKLQRFSLLALFPDSIKATLFVFAMNDGFLEYGIDRLVLRPINKFAAWCNHVVLKSSTGVFAFLKFTEMSSRLRSFSPLLPFLLVGIVLDIIFHRFEAVRVTSLMCGLFLACAGLGEKKSAIRALMFTFFANIFAFLSLTTMKAGLLYVIGIVVSAAIALDAVRIMKERRNIDGLQDYQGLLAQFPKLGFVFLVGLLGMLSFPISTTFFGEDLMLTLSSSLGLHYLLMFQAIFIVTGINAMRVYAALMFGKRGNSSPEVNVDMSGTQVLLRLAIFFGGNVAAIVLAMS